MGDKLARNAGVLRFAQDDSDLVSGIRFAHSGWAGLLRCYV